MTRDEAAALPRAILIAAGIDLVALGATRAIGPMRVAPLPSSFVTHTLMLALSVAAAAWLSGGRLASFGFTRGSFRFRPGILLWALPTAALSVLQILGTRGRAAPHIPGIGSPLMTILFIWIYASVCEEALVRGLFQGALEPLVARRVRVLWRWPLSVPVLAGALFFAAMHAVLWPAMGPRALAPMILAFGLGLVAGHHRERTGSLIPAILIHALFNIGGSVPFWIAGMAAR